MLLAFSIYQNGATLVFIAAFKNYVEALELLCKYGDGATKTNQASLQYLSLALLFDGEKEKKNVT